jgi:hypothetical protein
LHRIFFVAREYFGFELLLFHTVSRHGIGPRKVLVRKTAGLYAEVDCNQAELLLTSSLSVCSGHVLVLESLRPIENQIRFGGAAMAAESLGIADLSSCIQSAMFRDPLNLIRLTPSKGETAIRLTVPSFLIFRWSGFCFSLCRLCVPLCLSGENGRALPQRHREPQSFTEAYWRTL